MLKHVAKHNDKKVIILFRQVPGEDHMCLVVYSDLLPRTYHDALMQVVESPEGQATVDLAEVLNRRYLPNGELILPSLHKNSFIRKVQCNQVIIQANPKSSIKLDALNDMLEKLNQGGEAAKKLAEVDQNLGIKNSAAKPIKAARTLEEVQADSMPAPGEHALTDEDLANNLLKQSAKMKADAETLLKESNRLEEQAKLMTLTAQPAATTPTPVEKVAKKRGPKPKVKTA